MKTQPAKPIRVFAVNASGETVAEARRKNTTQARNVALWLLHNAVDATRAFVPADAYEVCK